MGSLHICFFEVTAGSTVQLQRKSAVQFGQYAIVQNAIIDTAFIPTVIIAPANVAVSCRVTVCTKILTPSRTESVDSDVK